VLAAGGGLQVRGVDGAGHAVALHAPDENGGVLAGHRRVLAGGFLAPAPSRVPEYVDVGRPEGEPLGLSIVVHRPRLHTYHLLRYRNDEATSVPGLNFAEGRCFYFYFTVCPSLT
jgi:hypothetical protein